MGLKENLQGGIKAGGNVIKRSIGIDAFANHRYRPHPDPLQKPLPEYVLNSGIDQALAELPDGGNNTDAAIAGAIQVLLPATYHGIEKMGVTEEDGVSTYVEMSMSIEYDLLTTGVIGAYALFTKDYDGAIAAKFSYNMVANSVKEVYSYAKNRIKNEPLPV